MPICKNNALTAGIRATPRPREAVRSQTGGTLDAEIIDRLTADLDAVKAESDSGTITIAFLPEQWETLVGIVAGHARTLTEANQLELSNLLEPANAQGATIIELRPYLEVQRELFSRAGVASHAAHRALMQVCSRTV